MAELDAVIGEGNTIKKDKFEEALSGLSAGSLATKLRDRRTDQIPGKSGVLYVGAARVIEVVTASTR